MKPQSLMLPMVFGFAANVMAATAPGAPTNVSMVAWPYTCLVYFTPPANNGGAPITNYHVSACHNSGGTYYDDGWIEGDGTESPIMASGGPLQWGGNPFSFKVTATNSAGTSPASTPSATTVTLPGGTSANVYVDGVFYWEGTYDFNGLSDATDTTGHPVKGPYDLAFTGNGLWQPWAPGSNYDLTPYKYIMLDLKPTTNNTTWLIGFVAVGDVSIGNRLTIPSDAHGTYGPAPVAGKWTTYKLPIATFGVGTGTANPHIFKFSLGTGAASTWYTTNVKFTADSSTAVIDQAAPVVTINRSMIVSVNNRTVNFAAKNAGTIKIFDVLGNQLAMLHADPASAGQSWVARSTGAYLVRFEGAGTVETQRVLVR